MIYSRINAMAIVKHHGMQLDDVVPELRDDRELVEAAVKNDPRALAFASRRLCTDRDMLLLALGHGGFGVIGIGFWQWALDKRTHGRIHGAMLSREQVRSRVSRNGLHLMFHVVYFDDDEVVRCAVANDGLALLFASPSLRVNEALRQLALCNERRACLMFPVEERAQYMRAGPIQLQCLFRHMPSPFSLPEALVEVCILPHYYRS